MVGNRSWWGWGTVEAALSDTDCAALSSLLPGLERQPVPVPAIPELPQPRVKPPPALAGLTSADARDRAGHTYGKAFRDIVRALAGDLSSAPDLVAYPETEQHIVDLLDWASAENVAVVPYGGGSSVVGGVECRDPGDRAGVVSMDLSRMDRVLEVDASNRAARVQAGVLGPALEKQLKPYGLTLRHFPQSFEFSSLGGWLATRSAGHYATLHTHIDDAVESLRVVTPVGVNESLRVPDSGAGPSPDRLFLGSEGALGIITEAWLRLREHPKYRAAAAVRYRSFDDGVAAARAIAQSDLYPANCRLLDPGEANLSGVGANTVLMLGFESATGPVEDALDTAVDIATSHGGVPDTTTESSHDPVAAWRDAFLRMPYLRDGLARLGAVVETFETACAWDTVVPLYHTVRAQLGDAIREVCGEIGLINCRLTHVYPDGAVPYFTVIAPGRIGSQVAMWDQLKTAASEIVTSHGGTITHHHAVGRDHRPWYEQQRPEPYAAVLRAAKRALDPAGILNPGVLID